MTKLRHYAFAGLVAAMALLPSARRACASEPGGAVSGYVVLTSIAPDDPYYAAVMRLQEYRQALIVRFQQGEVSTCAGLLRWANPRFVAVVARPETIDINFVYDMLELAAGLDDDPFADFAYGFVTGATAADALGLVNRTMAAEVKGPLSTGRLFAFGPSETPQADKGNAFEWLPAWRSLRAEHETGRFPQTNLADLASADVVRYWGHGAPDEVEGSLVCADLKGLTLQARAVFAGPCFSGVTGRYFESASSNEVRRSGCVDADRSLALTFLSKGVTGYFGAVDEDRCISAGQEMEHALTSGEPLGATFKHGLDRIVMASTNGTVRLTRIRENERPAACKGLDGQLRLAASRILFGDPAYLAFAASQSRTVASSVREIPGGIEIVATLKDPRLRSLFVNPFRSDLCSCDTDNDTLYVQTRLPEGAGAIRGVPRIVLPQSLEKAKHGAVMWKAEEWQGGRYLHVQVDFTHGTLRDVAKGAEFRFVFDWAKTETAFKQET